MFFLSSSREKRRTCECDDYDDDNHSLMACTLRL